MINFNQLETLNKCLIDWNVNYSVYPYNGYTINEVLCQFFDAINKGIITINEYTKMICAIMEWIKEEGLKEEVEKALDKMVEDGTFDDILNEKLLGDIMERLDEVENTNKEQSKAIEKNANAIVEIDKLVKSYGFVTVNMFGAKGDGETDDTKAFNDAINYCKERNITSLFIPYGNYLTTGLINATGVNLVGMYKPVIPFLEWEYTRPTSQLDHFEKYFKMCKGSVIGSKDNTIFVGGLDCKNIGLFGNRRKENQSGYLQLEGGYGKGVNMTDCFVSGFGGVGVKADYGLISSQFINTTITQCGKEGLYIGKVKGTYTGETNFLTIERCTIYRNESHGILADVMGRGFNIILNDFEFNGEPSDPQRPKPTSVDDMVFGCKLLVSGNGGFSSGAIKFEGNYTEETLGMLYIKNTGGTCQGVDINCNMAYPYNTTEMENIGIYLDGWLDRINISNNNMYFAKKLVLNGNQIQSIRTDIEPIHGGDTTGSVAWQVTTENGYNKIVMNSLYEEELFSKNGFITREGYHEDGVTHYPFDKSNTHVNGVEIDYDDARNPMVGKILILDGNYVGYVHSVSWTQGVINIRGNRVISRTSGNVKFVDCGGFITRDGTGTKRKMVIDWDGTVVGI